MEVNEALDIDPKNRQKKFGLPNWMVNNMERLNFSTDFEQYACSPPENESFLPEIDSIDFKDIPQPSVILNEVSDDKIKVIPDIRGVSGSKSSPNLVAKAADKIASLSVIESIKQEEFYSSPDTTPCATPEPSPLTRRRLSGQMQHDSVQTNPGRWFYLGNFKTPDPNAKGQNLDVTNNKVNKLNQTDKLSDSPNKLKSPVKKKEGIKLVISNFDINAISPSSW